LSILFKASTAESKKTGTPVFLDSR